MVYVDRDFYGGSLNWLFVRQLGGGTLSTTVGIDIDRSIDDRRGFENFIADQSGVQYGVKGRLRRDEVDVLRSFDPYVQTECSVGPGSSRRACATAT